MYRHHEKAVDQLRQHFSAQPGVLAVLLDGSVARGTERVDSDIDGIIVVTPGRYESQKQKQALAEVITGVCDYEGGYFDVKYYTKALLLAAAEKGNEPTRHAFRHSRVLHTTDPGIPGIVERIPVFQKREKAEKLAVFYANLMMNHSYYWPMPDKSRYLALRTASEIVFSGYRMVLQENETLFACQRELEKQVAAAPDKPEGIVFKANAFLQKLDDESEKAFVSAVLGWTSFEPETESLMTSKYLEYYEHWWSEPRPFVNEW